MKYALLILFLSVEISLFAQQNEFPKSPYNDASEKIKTSNAFQREKWFYEKRMFPSGKLSEDAYFRALNQRNQLRISNGFFFDNNVTWVSIGPTPGSYALNGSTSSRIPTVKYDPVNPDIIYLGAAYGGVWKSTDAGLNWVPLCDNEISMSSGALAIDPLNTNIVYYGTGEATYSGVSYTGKGLLKSSNGGLNWIHYTNGLPSNTYFSRLVIRPGHNNELFAALGTYGFFKSTNYGESWIQILSGRTDDVIFTPTGDTCYITGNSAGAAYRISTDGGNTFTIYSPFPVASRNHIGLCKSKPSIMYAATYNGEVTVYKSTNAGYNFSQIADSFNFNGSQAWYDFYVHVSPFDEDFAVIGTFNVIRTTNGGINFNYINYSTVHVDQHNMDFHPFNQNEMIAANDGGVWKSTNRGTTWINLNNTLNLTQFYKIGGHPANSSFLMGGTQDNGTQKTLGTLAWSSAYSGDGGEVVFHPLNPNLILGETQNNGVFRSTNGGLNFSGALSGLTGNGSWIAPIIAHPVLPGVFFTGRQAIFKTTNSAASWIQISSGSIGTAREMDICKSNPDVIYSASSNAIYKSSDGGATFSNITSGLPAATINDVKVHPDSSNVIWVCQSSSRIYKSTNGGVNWISKSGNLPSPVTCNDLAIPFYDNTKVLIAAMDVGVFITTNDGITWTELASGLPNTICEELDYHYASGKLRIGTHGRGVWELNSLITGIPVLLSNDAAQFYLTNNYPNPFNPVTKFKFSIPERQFVSLNVFDMSGRLISKLVNKILDKGVFEIEFNGNDLSSGTYIYKLITNSNGNIFTDSRKMILIK